MKTTKPKPSPISNEARALLRDRSRKLAREIGVVLRDAVEQAQKPGATWEGFTQDVQHVELSLGLLRSSTLGMLLPKKPEQFSIMARELACGLQALADELDNSATTAERRKTLEEVVPATQRAFLRAQYPYLAGAREEIYLRGALVDSVVATANFFKEGIWQVPDAGDRWLFLADEVERLFCETVAPEYRQKLRKHRQLVADALQACCNTGGRGKRAPITKSEALINLCEALGFPAADYDSIRTSRTKKRPSGTKKKQV